MEGSSDKKIRLLLFLFVVSNFYTKEKHVILERLYWLHLRVKCSERGNCFRVDFFFQPNQTRFFWVTHPNSYCSCCRRLFKWPVCQHIKIDYSGYLIDWLFVKKRQTLKKSFFPKGWRKVSLILWFITKNVWAIIQGSVCICIYPQQIPEIALLRYWRADAMVFSWIHCQILGVVEEKYIAFSKFFLRCCFSW